MPEIIVGGHTVLFDEADREIVMPLKWHVMASRPGGPLYASANVYVNDKRTKAKMHRLVVKAPQGAIVDHINGDGLDNRRANLRLVTASQNLMNSRKPRRGNQRFKGVSFNKQAGRWCAYIKQDGHKRYLGHFSSEEDAARAYDTAAAKQFGEFARLNFAPEGTCPHV